MLKSVKLLITNCQQCPKCKTERTPRAGYALDYYCELAELPVDTKEHCVTVIKGGMYGTPYVTHKYKMIAGYVEWDREAPQDNKIPDWCPLNTRKGK